VPADIPDDLDDLFSREFNIWIVELWRKLHPQFSSLFDQPRSCLLAKTAQSFAHDLGVHAALGQRLSLEIGPDIGLRGSSRVNRWSKVRAAASRCVNASPRSHVLRNVAMSEVWRYSSL
jgi:hypothetical protein